MLSRCITFLRCWWTYKSLAYRFIEGWSQNISSLYCRLCSLHTACYVMYRCPCMVARLGDQISQVTVPTWTTEQAAEPADPGPVVKSRALPSMPLSFTANKVISCCMSSKPHKEAGLTSYKWQGVLGIVGCCCWWVAGCHGIVKFGVRVFGIEWSLRTHCAVTAVS